MLLINILMKITDLTNIQESLKTPCQTPGAVYHITVKSSGIKCKIDFPDSVDLSKDEAELLEKNIHNALEVVLRGYFDDEE